VENCQNNQKIAFENLEGRKFVVTLFDQALLKAGLNFSLPHLLARSSAYQHYAVTVLAPSDLLLVC